MTKHLYIHIPFCKNICSYCDFCRTKVKRDDNIMSEYVDLVINFVKKESYENQYSSIYLGGGTPNFLPDKLLDKLLSNLKLFLDKTSDYEYCLECNPEFINEEQAKIFLKHGINRVSLGVQSVNNKILKSIGRDHTVEDVQKAINILYKNKITNINLDFLYALPKLTNNDLNEDIKFAIKNNIKHLSFYALEIKEGSLMKKQDILVDEDQAAEQLEFVQKTLAKNKYKRYEVSNWALEPKYESIHNKAYWLTNDWKAIGIGASGFEENVMYKWEGDYLNWKRVGYKLGLKELYLQVLMMGLRLVDGIDVINNERNSEAYKTYFNDLTNCYIKDGNLKCININLLHESLLNIVDETKEKQLSNVINKVYEEEE